jgi:hypothetical protein
MNWIKKLFSKKEEKQCAISGVVARLSSTYGQIYVHKETNPDRVYLSSESPQLKHWCKVQTEKLRKRDF